MSRIAIIGVGSIGGVIAGLLQSTHHHEITLCTRRPLPSLTITTDSGDIAVKAKNVTHPDQIKEPADWILVATKAYDTIQALPWINALSATAPIAIIQNGVEHRTRLAGHIPDSRIVPVIIDVPCERPHHPDGTVIDGIVHQRGPCHMWLQTGSLGSSYQQLFTGSACDVNLNDNFATIAWRKLCINSAGAISAILLKPAGVLRDPDLIQTALNLVRECVAVGRAEGAVLADTVPDEVIAAYHAHPPDSINSLLADRLAHRPMEIDARTGAIVRLGQKHNIPTPANQMALALLQSLQKSELSS